MIAILDQKRQISIDDVGLVFPLFTKTQSLLLFQISRYISIIKELRIRGKIF